MCHLRDYQPPMFLPYRVTTIADIHNDTAWRIMGQPVARQVRPVASVPPK